MPERVQSEESSAAVRAPAAPRGDDDLSLALRAANMGWWEWDLPDGEIRWSRGHEEAHGGATTPISYGEYLETIHPEDREPLDALIRRAIDERGSYETEFRTLWPDGSAHWMHGVGRVFCDEHGVPVRLAGVARLIDDERTARDALRQADHRFRRLADSAPVLLWVSGPDGGCTFVNESLLAFTGRTFEEELGDRWTDVVHPDDVERCRGIQLAGMAQRAPYEMEYRMLRHDGVYRWVLDRGRPLLDEDGTFRGFVGGCVDIHERREAEERNREAAETQALLDAIYRDAPIGLAFFDADLRYVRVNAALAEINGIPEADHLGKRIGEILPEMDPSVERDIARVLETGEPIVDAEVTGATPRNPGRPRHYQVSHYRVALADGEPLGVGTTVLEVTGRREADAERERLLARERLARRDLEAAHARQTFLVRLGAVLERSLHLEETVPEVLDLLLENLADAVAIDDVPIAGRPAQRIGSAGRPGAAERPEDCATTWTVPLVARGRHVGAVVLGWEEDTPHSSPPEARWVNGVAQRLGLWIDNTHLYAERAHVAATLQAGLLPPDLPAVPGAEVAARYLPAGETIDVGGDFYDVFPAADGGWAVAVGDVCGKGAEAASLTALARYTLRAAFAAGDATAGPATGPAHDLVLLNRTLLASATPERFVTAVLAHVTGPAAPGGPEHGVRLRLASAGHPAPIVVRADGTAETVDVHGPLLGVVEDAGWPEVAVDLAPGDAIVLATDGVTEADRDEPMDSGALAAAIRAELDGSAASAEELAGAVERIARRRAGGTPRDDVAVLVLRARQ